MDVCLYGRCQSSYSRPTDCREYRIQLNYCPSLLRRPTTSYSSRQAFSPSPRIQSANPRVAMATPRTQVSMAGFFDWSTEELDEMSASSVYQKIAITNKHKFNNKGNKSWCTDGIHLNPGRMFVRDKADLTKGEREIIAGIYKNRSDIHNKNGQVSNVKSHKDAWLVGKPVQSRFNSPRVDCELCSMKVPEHLFSRLYNPAKGQQPAETYICDACKEECGYKTQASVKPDEFRYAPGRKAPPSSPTTSPRLSRKSPPKLSKAKAAEGAILIESGKTFYDPYEGSKKKKIFVDVFLPKFPSPLPVQEEQPDQSHEGDEDYRAPGGQREIHTDRSSVQKYKDNVCTSQENTKLFANPQPQTIQTSS